MKGYFSTINDKEPSCNQQLIKFEKILLNTKAGPPKTAAIMIY